MDEQRLIAALQRAQVGDDGSEIVGFTSGELRERLGWSYKRMMGALHTLNNAGQLEVVMVKRANICGRVQGLPGYRLKKAASGRGGGGGMDG